MEMRKLYHLFTLCALFSLAFISCKDDEGELLTPGNGVSDLTFVDHDIEKGKIGGTLTWKLPDRNINIDEYVIYMGENGSLKTFKLGEVPYTATSFDIPHGTEYSDDERSYIMVVARNASGESSNIISISVNDNTGPVVVSPQFTDTDMMYRKIGGTLSWTLPESEAGITGYTIYTSNESSERQDRIGEAAAGDTSFEVPEGTDYKKYLLIVSKDENGESDNIAYVTVEDEADSYDGGIYVLNRGNWGENNASLSFYDFTTETITTNIFSTANGNKALGDIAEQVLVYGSKMYITVTISNRLVVTDLKGKLIKGFNFTEDSGEDLGPRCMAPYGGKIYISCQNAHIVTVLDTASLDLGGRVDVGRFPEQLAVANGKLYVANSGQGTGKTVSVINPESMTIENEIEVIANPVEIASDSQGDVYVISWADHGQTADKTLQKINTETNEVTTIGNATNMDIVNDKIYTIQNQYFNSPGLSYKIYNALTDEVIDEDFITDGTTLSSPNGIAVDPITEKIYITDFVFGSTSQLCIFSAGGKLEKKISTGGYDAVPAAFVLR